ncbi:L,D-transpeptidase family protein [Flavobacterium sp.]|uniref:L,D-transpeptidase family protein n=1 Tax=Flavobacterium sp. TaxID=239 RepID=UPI00286E37DA|nr:L,D-transpeptidase family protein [Flavobacterium sp.]
MKIIAKIILIFLFFISCKKENKAIVSTIKTQNYTDLFLSESVIESFFKTNSENETVVNEVNLFYKNRNFQYAWFNKKGMTQAVPNFQNQLLNYSNDFEDKTFNNAQLDTLVTMIKTNPNQNEINIKQREKLELILTTTFFKYSQKAFSGINKTARQLDWYIPRSKKNYQVLLDSMVLKAENEKTYEPVNLYYSKLKEKLRLYRDIQKKGGFPLIKMKEEFLTKTESDSVLIQVKKRLVLSGDLKSNDNNVLYTMELANAISNFQQRVGLPENGKLDFKTIAELNKTVDIRIKQMLVNMERLRWVPVEIENDYLLVNIPEYKLHVFESKKLIWETNVVVGKEAKQTSIFRGNISRIILNPYWNVPNSIINHEILPKLKRNANYLSRNNMEVVSNDGKAINASTINWKKYSKNVPFIIRQKPGNNNSLGKVKFLFPNSFSIYLHDTPSKELFNRNKRDFSHGCIRVENPKKLVMHLLQNDTSWNQEKVDKVLKTNTETGIAIKPNMPVYITYFTAWVDSNNNLNFRDDIYNLDDDLAKEIFVE